MTLSRTRCARCGKGRGYCTCEETCHRCLFPQRRCECEISLREERYDHQDDRFEEDEERADDFRRDYVVEEERSTAYWHGFNTARRVGKRTFVTCAYTGKQARKEFYRGVSDARCAM